MQLVGRDAEFEAMERFLAQAASGPAVAALFGEPGIGKTALWEAGIESARSEGRTVLEARPVAAEASLAFTGLGDLLGGCFGRVRDALAAPQRRALAVALLLEDPGKEPPDPRAVGLATVAVVHELAVAGPVVLAIDDLQWLDAASVLAVGYAMRRVQAEPIGFLLAERVGREGARGLELGRLPARLETTHLAVRALSFAAVQRLLHVRLGVRLPRPVLRAIYEASEGNPLFALELGRCIGDGRTPEDATALPGEIVAVVRARVARLPAETREVLVHGALLAGVELERVQAALDFDVPIALEPAIAEEMVVADAERLRFCHPLYASAVVELAGAAKRRNAHRRLASVARLPEQRARHLALATVDADHAVAARLEAAAAAVETRGAPAAAAELAEHAYRLTPDEAPQDGVRRAVRAASAWFAGGDAERAAGLLEGAITEAPTRALRGEALAELARVRAFGSSGTVALSIYQRALELADEHSALRARVLDGLLWRQLLARKDINDVVRRAPEAVALAERHGTAIDVADAVSLGFQARFINGRGVDDAAVARAFRVIGDRSDGGLLRHPMLHRGLLLLGSDRVEAARASYATARERAEVQGDDGALPLILMRLAHVELTGGDWRRAREYASEGVEIARQVGQAWTVAELLCTCALVHAHLGDADVARQLAAEGLKMAGPLEAGWGIRMAEWALGSVDLALGANAAAAERLTALWRASEANGVVDPSENRYAADLIEALMAAGQVDESEAVAAQVCALGQQLKRPSALAVASRGLALVAAARGEREKGERLLGTALEQHARAPQTFEQARSWLALGTLRRRARRRTAAREALEQALAGFQQVGAALWAARARSELASLGGRAPARGALTPSEQRVAALVAAGHTNREVADALFLAERTVEFHLSNIFAKLGIRSRAELAARGHTAAKTVDSHVSVRSERP